MRPSEGAYVQFYDNQDKEWKIGTILVYTETYSSAIIELDNGNIIVMPSDTSYRILKDERNRRN